MSEFQINAYPVRLIPFDLGRRLEAEDLMLVENILLPRFSRINVTQRQASILKEASFIFKINETIYAYIYSTGICVMVVHESKIVFQDGVETFSIVYDEDRKKAHGAFFKWEHNTSPIIRSIIAELREAIRKRGSRRFYLRKAASEAFENGGLSYVMTLSICDVNKSIINSTGFRNYPDWLKSNIYALLDPTILYLEDSSEYKSVSEICFDLSRILNELEINEDLIDYEKHRHINTFMSWSAVIILGQIQEIDIEEYVTLEVQLQSDWFYVYCLDKELDELSKPTQKDVFNIQRQHYEIDLLTNRLFDFDDSSVPARILNIQKGLVETSGLYGNIQRLQRKMTYILELERINSQLRQKRLGQSTEILLFIIAFIEIAPTVIDYGNSIHPYLGTIASALIIFLGTFLLIRKN